MSDIVTALLPCPFCGAHATTQKVWEAVLAPVSFVVDHLENCPFHEKDSCWFSTEVEAITAWNTRATPSHDRIAKLEEALALAAAQFDAIKQANDADDPDSYRSDDREGCFDWTFAVAEESARAMLHALTKDISHVG